MKIDAVILDFDGTVVDSEFTWKEVEQDVLTRHGYPMPQELLFELSGMGIDKWLQIVFEKLNVKNIDVQIVKTEILSRVYKLINDTSPLQPGFEILSEVVKQNNLPFAICTSSEFDLLLPTLKRLDITNLFQVLHSAHGYENMKPHPEPYLLTAEKLGVDIKNCVVAEDSITGIKSAMASGAKTFAIPYPHDLERAKQLDVEIVKDMSVVADYIKNNI